MLVQEVQTKTHTNQESRPMTISHVDERSDKIEIPEFLLPALTGLLLTARESGPLAELISGLMLGLRALGVAIVVHTLESRDRAFDSSPALRCPQQCDGSLRKTNKRKARQRRTLLGVVQHKRRVWKCERCREPCFPLDDQLGLLRGLRGHGVALHAQ